MLQKIIRKLTFKPKTINELNFYAARLKREKSIRAVGAILMVLTLLVQIVAAAVPAEKSYAASPNDIISGGVSSKADLVAKCRNNAQIRAIYARFDVTCDHLASGTTTSTTINSSGANYWSIGRTPLSSNGLSSDDWGEVRLNAGGTTVYQRPLKAWGNNVRYDAFVVKANGKTYWIIKDCGNLVTIGPYSRTPKLEVRKQLMSANTVKPGDTVRFKIFYRNPVDESVAVDFRLRDILNSNFELVGMDGRNAFIGDDPVTNLKGLGGSDSFREVNLAVKVKPNVRHGTEICNTARVSADVVGVVDSNKVCVTVVNPPVTSTPPTPPPVTPQQPQPTPKCEIPGKTNLPKDSPDCKYEEPDGLCVVSTGYINKSNKDFTVSTKAVVSGDNKVKKYRYVLDGQTSSAREVTTNALTNDQTYVGLGAGNHKVQVTVDFTNASGKTVSKTCNAEVVVAENAQVTRSKTVTRNGENMDGKKVNTGDVLEFKLTTKNITSSPYSNYSGEDYFGDVLDYADIVDQNQLASQGLTMGQDKTIRWNTKTIAANSEDVKTITVKVKSVIPTTNRPSNVSSDYDCIISNKYGNQVSMSLSCPLVKTVESTTKNLPNTGPGTTAAIAFFVTVVAGYFFARARIFLAESEIVRNMYHTANGRL